VLPGLGGGKPGADSTDEDTDKPSTFVQGVKRGVGTILSGVGRTGRDVGLPTRNIEEYGTRLQEENPADITSLGDIPRHPIQFAKETLAELTPQFGLSIAGAATGARIGGALGSLAGPEGTVLGGVLGGGVGAFAPSFVQSYGGQRQGQDELGVDNRGRAALAATGSAALDLLGPETSVARKLGTGALEKVSGNVARKIGLAGAKEAATEAGQEAIEDYGTSGTMFGPGSTERYGMAAIKGGLGGTVAGGIEQTFGDEKQRAKPQTLPEDEVRALPVDDAMPALGAPADLLALPSPDRKRLTGPTTIHGGAPDEPLRLTDQRTPEAQGRASEVYGPAIAAVESRGSGDYEAVGPITKNGDRALGRYQMMGRNLPKWTKDAVGRVVSPREFLASPEIQDQVFDHVFGGLVQKHGNAEDAASVWFTGRPQLEGGAARDVLGTTGHEYVAKFKAAMGGRGGMPTASGRDGVAVANADDSVVTPADMTPTAILQRINDIAGEGDSDTAERLAPQIARGGDRAAEAIGRERKRLDSDFKDLAARSDTMLADNVDAAHQRLQRRERTILAAVTAAERLAKAQAPEIITEPGPLPRPLPAEPQANPELAQLGEQLAAEGAQVHANDQSARTQMEQAQAAAARPAAEVAAETAERGKVLARAIADKNSQNPRADYLETLRDMGLPETLSPAEERTLRAEESFRRREMVREAAATQANLPEQDTSLGVPERAAPVEATVAATPVAETAPTPAPAPSPQERAAANIAARAETHIANLEMGPVQAKWFREGMKAEMGQDFTAPTTEKGGTRYNFERGRKFAASEQEQQAREAEATTPPARPTREEGIAAGLKARGEARQARQAGKKARREERRAAAPKTKPAPPTKPAEKPAPKVKPTPATKQAIEAKPAAKKPTISAASLMKFRNEAKAKQSRAEFLAAVDDAVPKAITAQQAQQLNKLEAQQKNLGTETVDEFSVKDLYAMLEAAKKERPGGRFSMTASAVQRGGEALAAMKTWDKILRSELGRMGLHDVHLFTTSMEDMLATYGQEGAQGYFDEVYHGLGPTIEVAHNAKDPLQVLHHETVHALRAMGVIKPGDWSKLVTMARSDRAAMDWINTAYAGLDIDSLNEEAVAEMFAEWATVHSDQAGTPFAKGLMGRIKAFFAALKRALTRSNYDTAEDVLRAIQSGALATQARSNVQAGRGGKYMMAGTKSATARLDAHAKAMKANSNEAARSTTGWHLGVDNNWRYEIDDSIARLRGMSTWTDTKETRRLGDVLYHPELFASYPQLLNMPVTHRPAWTDFKQVMQGWYDGKSINVTPYALDKLGTLLHEVQHAVQDIEGFASGGNSSQFKLNDGKTLDALRAYYERLGGDTAGQVVATPIGERSVADKLALLDDIEGRKSFLDHVYKNIDAATAQVDSLAKQMADLTGKFEADAKTKMDAYMAEKAALDATYQAARKATADALADRLYARDRAAFDKLQDDQAAAHTKYIEHFKNEPRRDWKAEGAQRKALDDEHRELVRKLADYQSALDAALVPYSSLTHDLYILLTGEVEARDTAARRAMSSDMRRATPPGRSENILPSEQISRFTPLNKGGGQFSLSRNGPEAYARRTVTRKASTAVKVSGEELLKKAHLWLSGTEDMANMMAKSIPSARKLVELVSNSHALSREFEERLAGIKDAYHQLPAKLRGTKPGSISELMYDSTKSGQWAFKPDYQPKAVVDPKLAERFNAMPEAAQKVIKDTFRYNFDSRNTLYRATVGAIDAEYDPLMAVAKTQEQKDRIASDKARAMQHFSRVFDTQEGLPYTPISREGWWAIVGKSKAYRDAEARGDQKAVDKMADDPAHHFVDFRDTAAEAEALHSHIATQFGEDGSYYFERNRVEDGAVNRDEVFLAFDQLKKAVAGDTDKGSQASARLQRLVNDLYLHSLSEASARKAELQRKGVPAKDPVTGEVVDMMHAFVSRGSATANFIASIANGPALNTTLANMHKEVKQVPYAQRRDAQRGLNEMMYRYTTNQGVKPSRTVDRIVRAVSMWTLLTSPFYYLQNATQHALIAVPIMSSKFGYARAWGATMDAYKDFAAMTKDTGMFKRVDYTKAPEDVRELLDFLSKRGRLDAGFAAENGHWEVDGEGILADSWNKADRFLRMMPQYVEVMNRVATGTSTYRLALQDGQSEAEARETASKMIYDTHGDYSGFNSPTPFHAAGSFGKVALQFRKFQLIMGALVAKEFHRAFKGATPEERREGFKALAFTSAHMAAIGGIIAQPGAAVLGPVIGALMNLIDEDDDKDWSNWQEDLKHALGAGGEGDKRNWLADLLFKGAPYALLSMDTSDRLGMGNIASLAPYQDLSEGLTSREKFFQNMGQLMLGPSGGMVAKAVDGWGFAEKGDWARMAESLMPGLVANTMKAGRLQTEGLTTKQGDILMKPEDISGLDAFYTALGVRPRALVNQADRRSADFEANQYYTAKTTELKSNYRKAAAAKDGAQMKAVRSEFEAIQKARERDGFKRQPLSTILKAPAEQAKRNKQVIGGVPTTKANRQFVAAMMYADTPQDALELMGG
jgi:hypothetical protein